MPFPSYPIRTTLLQHNKATSNLPKETIHYADYRVTDPFGIELPVGFKLRCPDGLNPYFRLTTCDAPYTDWGTDTITILRNVYRTATHQLPEDGHLYYTPDENIFCLSFHHSNWWPFEELEADALQHHTPPEEPGTPPDSLYQTTRRHDEQELIHIYSTDPEGNTHLTLFTNSTAPRLYAHYFAYTILTDNAIEYGTGALHAACNKLNHDPSTLRGIKLTEEPLRQTTQPQGFTPVETP